MDLRVTILDCVIIIEKIAECSNDDRMMNGSEALGAVFFNQLKRTQAGETEKSSVSLRLLLDRGSEVLSWLDLGSASIIAYALGYFVWTLSEQKNNIENDLVHKAYFYMSYYERNQRSEIHLSKTMQTS